MRQASFAKLSPEETHGNPEAPISAGRSAKAFPIYRNGENVNVMVNITLSYPAIQTFWLIQDKVGDLNNNVLNNSQLWRGALLLFARDKLGIVTEEGAKELAVFEEYLGMV